ncbi:MAG: hypothetical protein RIS43_64 [Actinomycetota bacterium]|jgi:hypothetical protein
MKDFSKICKRILQSIFVPYYIPQALRVTPDNRQLARRQLIDVCVQIALLAICLALYGSVGSGLQSERFDAILELCGMIPLAHIGFRTYVANQPLLKDGELNSMIKLFYTGNYFWYLCIIWTIAGPVIMNTYQVLFTVR